MKLLRNIAVVLWASPYTSLGLLIGCIGLLFGSQVRKVGRAIEFYDGGVKWFIHQLPNGEFTFAMTLGHVILGQTDASLEIARKHESVHISQYEKWGPFMLPAYYFISFYIWLRGKTLPQRQSLRTCCSQSRRRRTRQVAKSWPQTGPQTRASTKLPCLIKH